MKKLKLTDIAPYAGKRVQPFNGVKRYMSTGDLKGDNLSFEYVTFQNKPSRADITVSEGDILFAKMTNTNKALLIDRSNDGLIISTGFSVHRPIENVLNADYFLQFLKHDYFQRQKNKLCTGAIQSAISNTGIEKILVPVPDFSDQLHIANLLTKAENLISQRKGSIALLDEFLKSTFLEMFGDPVRNEKGWDKIQLQKISEIQGGLQVTSKREINPIELPYLRVANVYRNFLDLSIIKTIKVTKEEAERARLEKGDILIVEGHGNPNEIGRSSIWDGSISYCLHQNHLIRVRVNYNFTVPIYVDYFINSPSGRQQMFKAGKTTSGLNTISSKIVKETVINLPPIELQTRFAQIVEKTEALKTQYQQSLQELENLYGSLSQRAFKGQLGMLKAIKT